MVHAQHMRIIFYDIYNLYTMTIFADDIILLSYLVVILSCAVVHIKPTLVSDLGQLQLNHK